MRYILILFTFILLIIKSAIADEKTLSIKCKNLNNTTVFNFKINKKKNLYTTVYKKIKKRFIEIGEVVGQKNSSFILFEDKYAYLGVDFAWHYDKNTYRLRPVLLSEGTIKLKNLPEELSCVIISNN